MKCGQKECRLPARPAGAARPGTLAQKRARRGPAIERGRPHSTCPRRPAAALDKKGLAGRKFLEPSNFFATSLNGASPDTSRASRWLAMLPCASGSRRATPAGMARTRRALASCRVVSRSRACRTGSVLRQPSRQALGARSSWSNDPGSDFEEPDSILERRGTGQEGTPVEPQLDTAQKDTDATPSESFRRSSSSSTDPETSIPGQQVARGTLDSRGERVTAGSDRDSFERRKNAQVEDLSDRKGVEAGFKVAIGTGPRASAELADADCRLESSATLRRLLRNPTDSHRTILRRSQCGRNPRTCSPWQDAPLALRCPRRPAAALDIDGS